MFSSNKRTTATTPTRDLIKSSNSSTLINPSDGRRYKKTVVEDHLSELTFSPNLNSKTTRIDNQLT